MSETETAGNHARRLRGQYLAAAVPDSIAERVYAYAWQEGHANGLHEVEFIYDDLANLVNAAFLAGKAAR